jgi:hypothetical protein
VAEHPGQQQFVAVVGGRELTMSQQSALVIYRAGVVRVLVGVDAADDTARLSCHARTASPLGVL